MDPTRDNKDKFDWDRFLESRDLVPAPNFAFQHVDKCQQSLLEVGMMVEVQTNQQPRFWLATVTMKCGPFLRLKHVGQEDASKEIWTDPSSVEVRPVGYSSSHGWNLEPPEELKDLNLLARATELVEEHRVVDCEASLLSPALQMKTSLVVEVEDLHQPRTVWAAEVKRNVGGRLLVQYVLPEDATPSADQMEVVQEWIFCLSPRLHWQGWADSSWSYNPPAKISGLSDKWSTLADVLRSHATSKPWQFNLEIPVHNRKVEDRFRAVDPRHPFSLRHATVTQVIDDQRYAIRFEPDVALADKTGEQDTSLLNCFTARGDEGEECDLEPNMALEVVNPLRPSEICVGVVTAVEENGRLLRIRPETEAGVGEEFFISASSQDLFPVGWCDSQNYPLSAPLLAQQQSSLAPADLPEEENGRLLDGDKNRTGETTSTTATTTVTVTPSETTTGAPNVGVSFWCPKIYFNFRCFSGPLLSRIRVAALPRSVGPGPIGLVMKEVLSQLMNGAYKPGSVLKQLQGEPGDPLPPGTTLEPMKAKYRQTTYRGSVPVACTAAVVPDYCRWVCDKLQCCPYLFGPELVGDPCPHRCCILAKAVWQHKKKAPNWRHRRFVDILKSSESLLPADVEAAAAALAAANATESSTTNKPHPTTVFQPESAEQSPEEADSDAAGHLSGDGATKEEGEERPPPAKKFKKRGRPKKNPLPQPEEAAVQQQNNGIRSTATSSSPSSSRLVIPAGFQAPHLWNTKDVWRFLQSTDCQPLADRLLQQEVDGPSLLLLRPADVADYVTLNWQLAVRLCRLIDSLCLTYSG